MKRIILLLAFASLAFAQRGTYTVSQKTALSGTAEVVTVQLPASVARGSISFNQTAGDGASIYCSVECEYTVEYGGTAATTTAITPAALPGSAAAQATAYRVSNVGAGTVASRQVVPAGATMSIGLAGMSLVPGQNVTIRTAAITGTVIINVQWREF